MDRGVDLQKPRKIDFYCYCKADQTEDITQLFESIGLSASVFHDDEDDDPETKFSIYGTITMVPDYDQIMEIQALLNRELRRFNTHCDGWGTMSD